MNQFREDIKIISPRWMSIPKKLEFLFQEGWSKRAGVVPYTIEDGKYMLLLGEKKYNKKITDLGGGCPKSETPLICAQREFKEESRETLKFNLKNVTHIVITGVKGPHQVIFLVYYPQIGDEEFSFFKSLRNEKLNKKGYSELNMLEWIAHDDIVKYERRDLEASLYNLLKLLVF